MAQNKISRYNQTVLQSPGEIPPHKLCTKKVRSCSVPTSSPSVRSSLGACTAVAELFTCFSLTYISSPINESDGERVSAVCLAVTSSLEGNQDSKSLNESFN